MQYRKDPKTGNKLSALGFGCMRFPGVLGRIDMEKTEKLIVDAVEKGVNYFDTAYLYTGSEEALGTILQKNGLRDQVFIATKLPQVNCKSREDFDHYFDIQKERLRTDHIDYYFIHNISDFAQWEKLCSWGIEEWLESKKRSGEIRQTGFSYHGSKDDFPRLLEAYDWDFCQIQYNYINIHYQAGVEGLKAASEKGLPVFIMEPLLGGKLASGLPKKAEEVFRQTAAERTSAAWALRWLWNQPEVTLVLSGMNDPKQLDENIRTAETAGPGCMTQREEAAVGQVIELFGASYKVPCTGCNYCMPCPQMINIPGVFSAYNASYSLGRISGIMQYLTTTSGMTDHPHFASACIRCGKCEGHCPQNISIRDELLAAQKRLEPFWLKSMVLPVYKKLYR